MPHINRIRVNNVKYNFGTQFYDDFVMRFDGRNALYDLANGGGKSVLMLLLFQNLIPNCTLDDKQPVEKLFRGDGSTTIHSLVEWRLDRRSPGQEEDPGYKYMLTGFCARKAKDEASEERTKDAASIDYFNYVIFYREYNDNDIINLPLKKGNERITYGGLKGYLKELGRNDYNLSVHVFERKGEYQRFIVRYGLYESAWEIIRGINKTEGHVRTYFETSYRTTRKVVEDLLIEEIIQKSFQAKSMGETGSKADTDMAKMLLDIKDKLMELSKCKEEISGYDRQTEIMEAFAGRVETLNQLYTEEDNFCEELVKVYNTADAAVKRAGKALALAQKEKDLSGGHIGEISRKLDIVKIQENRERLRACEKDTRACEADIEKLRMDREKLQLDLNMKQSMNDYIEYVRLSNQAAGVRHALESVGSGDDTLLEKLKCYAIRQKLFYDEKQTAWAQEQKEIKRDIKVLGSGAVRLENERRQMDRDLAVTQNNLEREQAEEKNLLGELSQLRMSVNTLLVEGAAKELKAKRSEQRKLEDALNGKRAQLGEVQERIHTSGVRLENLKVTGENLAAGNTALSCFFEDYAVKKTKADKLMAVYHASDYRELKSVIYGRYKKVILDIFKYREEISHDRTYMEQLSKLNPVVAAPELEAIMDHIRRIYGATCVLGSEYLGDLEVPSRQALLERMPYLPYCVIVKNDFVKVCEACSHDEKEFGDLAYPIVSLESVLADNEKTIRGGVYFAGKNPALFYDKQAAAKKQEALKKKLDVMEKELERLLDNETTYLEDVEYLGEFIMDYYDKYVENSAALTNNRRQQEQLEEEIKQLQSQQASDLLQIETYTSEIQSMERQQEDLAADIQALTVIGEKEELLEQCRSRMAQLGEQKRSLEVRQNQNRLASEQNAADSEAKGQRCAYLEQQIAALEKTWEELYAPYYEEGADFAAVSEAEPVDSDKAEGAGDSGVTQDSDALDAAFRGVREAFEKKFSDMEDKRRLLESYEQAAARLLALIEERAVDVQGLKILYDQGQIMEVSAEAIAGMKGDLLQISEKIRTLGDTVTQMRASKDRLSGGVENAIAVVEEKYGSSFEEVDLKNHDFATFTREQQAALTAMKEKYARACDDLEKASKDLKAAEDIRKDLERLMRTARVTYNRTRDFYAGDYRLRQGFEALTEQYERLRREENRRRDEFEKNRDRLADTLKELKAYELADEVRYHIQLPKSQEEAERLLAGIRETIQIIGLEKQRISQGIEDMVQIKESFENQCLQRCLDIRTELERLPKLSKITLDGKVIPMVQLKIPYIREEFYRQRMSEYIDAIVVNADAYRDFDEKLKYIRKKLSWKSLFSVIVTDMNAIRLNLYKRERIHGQSRYLKYEEAVGSTGQSQGIYIQFLIAVINYISALNSGNENAADEGKVIFIDNPFGAAKDIYIWEPIFELLKTNNVQLIVPARGATPAITGKFDVNYVLGQKIIDDKQQTVVVDYHSNIRVEDVEYVKIDFEQEVFDFI